MVAFFRKRKPQVFRLRREGDFRDVFIAAGGKSAWAKGKRARARATGKGDGQGRRARATGKGDPTGDGRQATVTTTDGGGGGGGRRQRRGADEGRAVSENMTSHPPCDYFSLTQVSQALRQ